MPGQPIVFGPFLLNPDNGTLFRNGELVAVGKRGSLLLGALLKSPGQVRTKAELMDAAWPGTAVEESNLSVQIASLRKLLGPSPDGGDWIATIPRVGYRFVGQPEATTPVQTRAALSESVLPSLAVLPFHNLSGDAEQDYFADGVVEDIITALSRFRSFAVIARNSSFVYKGRAVDVRQAAKELGVRYVLEGSVRRAGNRLRITAQLIETESGTHLWAQNFDGAIEDVFDVQDRIIENVVAIVEPRVTRAEIERARRKPPDNLDAYDLYLRAMPDVYAMRPEANANAIRLLEQAVVLDPGFAPGVAMAGMAYLARITMQLPGASDRDFAACLHHARAALAIGGDDSAVLGNCGFLILEIGHQYGEGFALLKRAVAENPNNVGALTNMGIACLLSGDLDEGVIHLERAIRLNPNDIGTHWQLTGIAHIRMAQGRYEEALEVATRSLAVNSGYDATYWMLISASAYLDRMEDAGRYLAALRALSPGVSVSRIRRGQHSKDPHRIDVLIEGLRMAGMPET